MDELELLSGPRVWLELERVKQIVDPFHRPVWQEIDRPITREEISHAIFTSALNHPSETGAYEGYDHWTRTDHVGRIASLVEIGWSDPIDIEIPDYAEDLSSLIVLDGHHRIAAAIYREDPCILVEICGFVQRLEELLKP